MRWTLVVLAFAVACSDSHGGGPGGGGGDGDTAAACTDGSDCQSGVCVPDAVGSAATYSCTGACEGLSSAAGSAVCAAGSGSCLPGWVHWSLTGAPPEYCACDVTSAQDACNGIDDNCDGRIDEDGDALCAAAIAGEGCQAGQCLWCPARCAGSCDDPAVDLANCGGCGTACPAATATTGPACSATGCQSLAVLAPPGDYEEIAADGSNVYVYSYVDGELLACSVTGCPGGPDVLATGIGFMVSLVQDATTLYWLDQDGVVSCAKTGCGTPTVLAAGDDTYQQVAITGATLVISLAGTSDTDGAIVTCPTTGCAATPPAIATGLAYPTQIQVFDGVAYFTAGAQGTQPQVFACPLTGCGSAPTPLYTTEGGASFTVHAGTLYFANEPDPQTRNAYLYSCPAAGPCTSPTQLAYLPYAAGRMYVDGANLYWLGQSYGDGVGVVETCPLASCTSPTVVAGGMPATEDFAITADAFYIATSNRLVTTAGPLYKLAR